MTALVSILIPAYNAEKWIGDALQSALTQTWMNKEIIVVDDGSSDHTLAAARRFESRTLRVVSQRNQGASAARNAALALCQGDYIQWLDADDLLAPDKIARQIEKAGDDQILLSSAWSRFYYRLEKARPAENSLWRDLQPVDWIVCKMKDNVWMAIESWLISRKLIEAAGAWDTTLSADDDGEYFSRIISACAGIRFVPEAKSYVRRANLNSLSGDFYSRDKAESQFRSMTFQISNVRKLEDSSRVRTACLKYLQRWLIYFYPEQAAIVERAYQLAHELGGDLDRPKLNWKYVPLQRFFGWTIAKKASAILPKVKAWFIKGWDRFLFELFRRAGDRRPASISPNPSARFQA